MNKQEMNEIELIIGKILRVGVIISVTVMIVGMVLLLIKGDGGYGSHFPTTFAAIGRGLLQFKPDAILMLGVFLLILTPVLRVIVSIYAFFKEQDYLYVYITVFVLIILVGAMIAGYWIGK
ncbi:DUF1634 domain-containing protein [Bombilactobacillus bombi]|uniref:DUF1634 domain-containing protein n=1 Tax=Bombilactobacillus bombi TaxID=1303590 RepID=A0A417ZDG8_9LACO|nr:DUF1634 domain-containing protein [Bombilactobacillus bombi]RHW48829.1 DUF1634 domain-containing protein [Bombilactobacillus bombi]